ncbi:MAG TPA: RNA-binding S4 domain-containing protein [Bacteriovoracaceae bacterium]|nr:RNA-binding S4 domain-containing protein [Bacteriovoracaceae bacterium]
MKDFILKTEVEFIPLCDLLKAADLCDSGGEAKHFIADGQVKVDDIVDTRKRRKVRRGEVVEFKGIKLKVV